MSFVLLSKMVYRLDRFLRLQIPLLFYIIRLSHQPFCHLRPSFLN